MVEAIAADIINNDGSTSTMETTSLCRNGSNENVSNYFMQMSSGSNSSSGSSGCNSGSASGKEDAPPAGDTVGEDILLDEDNSAFSESKTEEEPCSDDEASDVFSFDYLLKNWPAREANTKDSMLKDLAQTQLAWWTFTLSVVGTYCWQHRSSPKSLILATCMFNCSILISLMLFISVSCAHLCSKWYRDSRSADKCHHDLLDADNLFGAEMTNNHCYETNNNNNRSLRSSVSSLRGSCSNNNELFLTQDGRLIAAATTGSVQSIDFDHHGLPISRRNSRGRYMSLDASSLCSFHSCPSGGCSSGASGSSSPTNFGGSAHYIIKKPAARFWQGKISTDFSYYAPALRT